MSLNVPIAAQLPFLKEGISNSIGSATNSLSDIRGSVNSSVQDFASKDLVGSSTEFLQSNTIIAKFVFLILILIVFMILMNLGIYLLGYLFQPNHSPYLIKGLMAGNVAKQIRQDPSSPDSVTLYRSNNQSTGMECTWSFWLNVKSALVAAPATVNYSHVFSKGIQAGVLSTTTAASDGLTPTVALAGQNAPGVYLSNNAIAVNGPTTCTMTIVMDTVSGNTETLDVPNIPYNKWVHVIIRFENKIMDVYINGVLKNRLAFADVPKQNYGDVWVCQNGGFTGSLSNLRYFDNALNVFQITGITSTGPNMSPTADVVDTSSDYLSNKWF